MQPRVPTVLAELTTRIVNDIAPVLQDAYQAQQMQRSGLLLGAIAEEFDRAAARLASENEVLRALLGAAATAVDEPDLADALTEAGEGRDDDLRVHRLEAANHDLRSLLTRAHAWTERSESLVAKALNEAIWKELRASTERRALSMARF